MSNLGGKRYINRPLPFRSHSTLLSPSDFTMHTSYPFNQTAVMSQYLPKNPDSIATKSIVPIVEPGENAGDEAPTETWHRGYPLTIELALTYWMQQMNGTVSSPQDTNEVDRIYRLVADVIYNHLARVAYCTKVKCMVYSPGVPGPRFVFAVDSICDSGNTKPQKPSQRESHLLEEMRSIFTDVLDGPQYYCDCLDAHVCLLDPNLNKWSPSWAPK